MTSTASSRICWATRAPTICWPTSRAVEDYSKEALLYQAVAESLDIAPTQEQLDAYSDYKDTYGQNYCTMVALMDAVTSTLTSGAVVS